MVRKILFRILLGLLSSSGIWLLWLASPWLKTVGQTLSGTVSGRILLLYIGLSSFAVVFGSFLLAMSIAQKWFPDKAAKPDNEK